MKKLRFLPLLFVLLLVGATSASTRVVNQQIGDVAHVVCADGYQTTSVQAVGVIDVTCVAFANTPTPTATATLVPTATNTVVPPTATNLPPTATNTVAATSTATHAATSTLAATATGTATIAATATATVTVTGMTAWPLCPTENPLTWNGLVDLVRQCHYDHEQGDNPHLADAVFGPPAAAWGGQEISYPWETSVKEAVDKLGGYKYAVRLNLVCDPNADYNTIHPVNCITDFRIEYHVVSHMMDALARYHSFYAEIRVCQYPAFTQCGIMRYGGWADFGELLVPYISFRVVRPAATIDFGMGSKFGGGGVELIESYPADAPDLNLQSIFENSHYVAQSQKTAQSLAASLTVIPDTFSSPAHDAWSTSNLDMSPFGPEQQPYMHNPYLRFNVGVMDSWNLVDQLNPTAISWICRDGSCPYNGSLHGLFGVFATVQQKFDPNNTGFADYNGFTNRNGNEVPACAPLGVDCVPFSLTHMPVGFAVHHQDMLCNCGPVDFHEYDICESVTPKCHFIQFPN
jgi:hypothetical protein